MSNIPTSPTVEFWNWETDSGDSRISAHFRNSIVNRISQRPTLHGHFVNYVWFEGWSQYHFGNAAVVTVWPWRWWYIEWLILMIVKCKYVSSQSQRETHSTQSFNNDKEKMMIWYGIEANRMVTVPIWILQDCIVLVVNTCFADVSCRSSPASWPPQILLEAECYGCRGSFVCLHRQLESCCVWCPEGTLCWILQVWHLIYSVI